MRVGALAVGLSVFCRNCNTVLAYDGTCRCSEASPALLVPANLVGKNTKEEGES